MRSKLLLLFLTIAMLFSISGCSEDGVSLTELPNPAESAEMFFEHLDNEEYSQADDMIFNYTTLGMVPVDDVDDPLMQIFYRELVAHRKITPIMEPKVTGKTAVMTVQVSSLDLRKVYAPLSENVKAIIYDMRFDGQAVDSSEEILAITTDELSKIITDNKDLITTGIFAVEFTYTGGEWKLIISDELYSALIGYSV